MNEAYPCRTANSARVEAQAVRLVIDAVIVSVADETPRVLTVAGAPRLPSGTFVPARDRTLELAARRLITEQTGLRVGYLEQLYTFGDRFRDPREVEGGPRLVSVGYLVLVGVDAAAAAPAGVAWRDWYGFFPWEDLRDQPAPAHDAVLAFVDAPAVDPTLRRRARLVFGLTDADWNNEAVLERYELLYELGGVVEAPCTAASFGEPMERDHRRIVATAIGRLRGKIKYRPIVFELLPPAFTLSDLQGTVESLAGVRLHGPNFRRLVEETGIVEETGERRPTSGRPAKVYRFRPEVLAERPDPGIGIRGRP
ncbi:MAG: NAD regulator [Candidatus Eremiobacteraeota bacterium]|nr:NAD regulator [Candidatus Eremiobacteraeota bacterium]